MAIFENLTKKVTDTAKAAAKKSSELVEVTKLNVAIGTEEDKIKKVHTDIGKSAYGLFSMGEEVPAPIKEMCATIKTLEGNINKMRQKILELKKTRICPSCSVEVEVGVAFCPKCGSKQEPADEAHSDRQISER